MNSLDTLVGEFRIRHYLTDALRTGAGHIGYSINKDFRCKGYGTKGLGLTVEIAKNIRENGGTIPGVPVNKVEEYLTKVLNRIVLPGSIFLALIAIIPSIIINMIPEFPSSMAYLLGGTSLIIIVGVDLDTMSQIEGYLKMYHYDGIVKKGKIRSRNF